MITTTKPAVPESGDRVGIDLPANSLRLRRFGRRAGGRR